MGSNRKSHLLDNLIKLRYITRLTDARREKRMGGKCLSNRCHHNAAEEKTKGEFDLCLTFL